MPRWLFFVLTGAALFAAGCGGTSSSTTGNNPVAGPANNVLAITAGGSTQNPAGIVNGAFTSVTICAPGTSNCATIGGMLVDTQSTGVRVLSAVLPGGFSLPKQTDASGNPIVECLTFGDGFTWGPVEIADVKLSGEQASSLPIQVIADPNFPTVPSGCNTTTGPNENTVDVLGANGILGVGNFLQDCGAACTVGGAANPNLYFSCPASGCVVTTVALAQQVSHPVARFTSDNNGVIVELPPVATAGAVSTNGSLVFGIGTQSNNALGSATVLTLDANANFTTMFRGNSFPGSFVDSGSNGIFFLGSSTTGLPVCTDNPFYCPVSIQNFTATNQGTNGHNTTINFSVANADGLLSSSNPNFLLPDLAAPSTPPNFFDWGLPFFYGRNVFVAIEGQNTPGGVGPYTAY